MRPVLIDEALDERLEDWGMWVNDRMASGLRCQSAEGRYRPERVKDDEQRKSRIIDVHDATAIERAVCNTGFPAQARALLKGWYVLRVSRPQVCRLAGISRSHWEERMGWAGTILRNRLDKPEKLTTMHGNNSTSADPVSIPCPVAGKAVDERKAARQA